MRKEVKLSEIIHFIAEKSGENIEKIHPETNISDDLGVVGEDWHEFIEEFAKRYEANIESYLWYFHTEPEGFPPLRKWYKLIPVTPLMLQDFANKGFWDMAYPPHPEPEEYYKQGYDYGCLGRFFVVICFLYYLVYALVDWIW